MNTNPLKRMRKLEGYSLEGLAQEIDIHPQAMYLSECGVYPNILPSVMKFFVDRGYTKREVEAEYKEWVNRTRAELKETINPEIPPPVVGKHPFTVFRQSLGESRMGFSKKFLVHPASLYSLEKGHTKGLPNQLKEALLATGFTPDQIEELDYRCREFMLNEQVA